MTAIYRFGRTELRPATRQLLVNNEPALLGARAFDVLLALIERRDRLVTKNELLDLVWPGAVVEENNLQVQISALRKLLGAHAIATVAGRGYRFALEATDAAGPSPSQVPKHNLPEQVTSFIGRERELAELRQLLARNRLVTLIGVGGIGKTRLSLRLAATVREDSTAEQAPWLSVFTRHGKNSQPLQPLERSVASRRAAPFSPVPFRSANRNAETAATQPKVVKA